VACCLAKYLRFIRPPLFIFTWTVFSRGAVALFAARIQSQYQPE
jgi:hypothetical protein